MLDDGAGTRLDHQAHPGFVPGFRERHVGPDAGVEVASAAPGGEKGVAGAGHVAEAVGGAGPQGELLRSLPVAGGRQGRARDLERADHGPRAGPREEDDGEAASALRRLRLDARLEVPALLEAGDEEACVLLEGHVVEGEARLRAQARKEQRVGVTQLHGPHARARPWPQVVDHGLAGASRLRRRAHEGLAVALGPQMDLDALRSRLEAVARRPALAHEVTHPGEQLAGQLRAARLEAHPRARDGVEHEVHDTPPGVVGLAQLDRGPPPAGPGEATPHRVSRRLRLLPAEDLGGTGSRQLLETQRRDVRHALDPRASHADARTRADPEDRVRAARDPRYLWLDEGLEVPAPRESEADVARRPVEARGPQRLPGAQARGARGASGRDHAVALDAHGHEERGGAGTEDDLDPVLSLLATQLHENVFETPGREHQLDRAAHGLAVEGPAGHEAHERHQAFLLRRLHPDCADKLLRGRGRRREGRLLGGDEGEGEESVFEHQRDWRIRTSNAQPRSTPVLAVPGSVRVRSSEKRSVSAYSTARMRSSVPRRSCE